MSNLPALPPASSADSPPAVTYRRRSGCLGCGAAVGITLIVAAAAVIIVLLLTGGGTVSALIGSLRALVAPPTTAMVGDAQTLVVNLAPLSRLVTISAQLARADVPVRVTSGALNACGYSAFHVVQATIEAGVDLSLVRAEDLVYDQARDTYVVALPAPQYTGCSIDYIRQYQQSFTTCVSDWDGARQLAEYTSLQTMLEDTYEGGLLDRAGTEAVSVLTGFIGALTGKAVEVVFDASRQPAIAQTCARAMPPGWTYDAVNNQWTK